MNNHMTVTVSHATDNLLEEPSSIIFFELKKDEASVTINLRINHVCSSTYAAMFDNIVEEFTTSNVFHDHEDIRRCANHLIPMEDICT